MSRNRGSSAKHVTMILTAMLVRRLATTLILLVLLEPTPPGLRRVIHARLANPVTPWVRLPRRLALHVRLAHPVRPVRRLAQIARLANTVLLAGLALANIVIGTMWLANR